jgi:putative transcriptional regulator
MSKKAKTKIYKSEISAAIHESVSDLYEVGLVEKKTMRRFDESCLTPISKLTPA